jgi:putative ABC transport system permease protein
MPPGANRDAEAQLVSASARSFPAVSVIRVKEVLETLNDLVGKLALSIKGTSAVTVLAVILVLAGAVGSGQRARIHDAVVLKILGATRRRLVVAYALEFSVLALAAAAFGVMLGGAAAWALSSIGLGLAPAVPTTTIAIAVILAITLALVLGLAGTARVLSQRPGAFLKAD